MTGEQSLYQRFPSRSQVRERGYHHTLAEEAAIAAWQQQWIVENKAAVKFLNRWVGENGLPLAKYRMF